MTKTVSIYHYYCSECHGWIWCLLVVSWHQRSPKPFLNGADIMEMLSRGPSHLIFLVVPENIESNCWSSLNLPSTIFQKDPDVFRRKPCVLSGPFSATWPHSTVLLESLRGEEEWEGVWLVAQKPGSHFQPCHLPVESSVASHLTALEFKN